MSNHKYAFGWSGHILVRESVQDRDDETGKLAANNVVVVDDDTFDRIAADMESCNLPAGIEVEQLGWLSIDGIYFLAAGVGFTRAFTFYGAPFEEAELRVDGGPLVVDHDAEYLATMKAHYGLDLPPCRLMVGCASEH